MKWSFRHARPIKAILITLIAAIWFIPLEAAPAFQADDSSQVYALPGTLRTARNQPFATYLIANNGDLYGLSGQTPAIEQQIVDYRDTMSGTEVKVWGTLFPEGLRADTAEIIVTSIQPVDASVATPSAMAIDTAPTATVRFESVNVRSGPGQEYAVVGGRTQGQTCPITGRNADSTWWTIQCSDGLIGWISNEVVIETGDTDAVPIIPSPPPPPVQPTPTPLPPSANAWVVNYFSNRDLAGSPVLTQNVQNIQFNWGQGSPGPSVPVDNFSARFQRTMSFSTGTYEFRATYDDGVRVYVDGQPIINDWQEGNARSSSSQQLLSGQHDIRVEYFEATGDAALVLFIGLVTDQTVWNASYYNNTDLSGSAILVRGEPRGSRYPLQYNWGEGSPAPGVVNNDLFSARWVGSFFFEPGDYTFQVNVDDGARLYIDGIRVIDAWSDGYKEVSNVFYGIGEGNHQITVEYYERSGGAAVQAWWWRGVSGGGGGQPAPPPNPGGRPRDE